MGTANFSTAVTFRVANSQPEWTLFGTGLRFNGFLCKIKGKALPVLNQFELGSTDPFLKDFRISVIGEDSSLSKKFWDCDVDAVITVFGQDGRTLQQEWRSKIKNGVPQDVDDAKLFFTNRARRTLCLPSTSLDLEVRLSLCFTFEDPSWDDNGSTQDNAHDAAHV
uniref:CIA30 domain-containing protein n=1 Tax=Steinernema glaseri TaxID=37863 RepID=A0A1I8AJ79_9BILA